MAELVRICLRADLPAPGMAKEFAAGATAVCVANVDGKLAALDNICPHRGGPLAEGMIENGKVVCPWHAWEFDPATGECDTFPGNRVAVFPLVVKEEDVYVEI